MFESVELGRKVSKQAFNDIAPELRLSLIDIQQRLRSADFPVIVVLAGVDGAGKSELANLLNEWMDPRWIVTRAYDEPSEWEKMRPEFWRYWVDLPPKGRIGIYLSAWYSQPLVNRVYGRMSKSNFVRRLERISRFERVLSDDGVLVLKFWMHLSKDAQEKRLKSLEKSSNHHWQVTERDWENWRRYDKFAEIAEQMIERTSTGSAPWKIVDGSNPRHRSLTVLTGLRDAMARHLDTCHAPSLKPADGQPAAAAVSPLCVQPDILASLDLSASVSAKSYKLELQKLRGRLNTLYRRAKEDQRATILVFEGWDAAGKGGAIRRITAALDARDYRIYPFAAPSDHEKARHYLWRFWQRVPRDGKFAIFDRSWYGRVLVERVKGLASPEAWQRAYAEINEFEAQLMGHGILVIKFWLHIDKDEQARRFEARASTPHKRWKLTDDDWRNREKWDDYTAAATEMVERTSTSGAPWNLIEANDKRFARLKVLRTLCDAMDANVA